MRGGCREKAVKVFLPGGGMLRKKEEAQKSARAQGDIGGKKQKKAAQRSTALEKQNPLSNRSNKKKSCSLCSNSSPHDGDSRAGILPRARRRQCGLVAVPRRGRPFFPSKKTALLCGGNTLALPLLYSAQEFYHINGEMSKNFFALNTNI